MKISKDGTLTVFKEHEYNCSSKNGIIVKPIEQATSTEPIELSEMMAPTKPPPTFLDYTIEMFEQVDKLAVEDISTSAKKIWNEVSSNFRQQAQDAGSHSYKGISRRQAESHVYRTRNKANGGDIFRTIEAPPVSMVLNSKHNFLQFNFTVPNGDKTERVTGWGNPGLFGVLKIPGVELFVDATFSSCPSQFYQCLIIMAFDNTTGVYVPILYILMTKKTEEHYLHAIHCLMVVSDYKLKPNSITCDFERALMNAFRTKFPNADMYGCLFHFKQALRRKMISLHIEGDRVECVMQKDWIDILTIIRREEIKSKGIPYVRSLIEDEGNDLSLAELGKWSTFWAYFDRQWMSPEMVNIWNIHDGDEDEREKKKRTNNALERYNREMNAMFPTPHPGILLFVSIIEKEARTQVSRLDNIRNGHEEPPEYNLSSVTIPDTYTEYQP